MVEKDEDFSCFLGSLLRFRFFGGLWEFFFPGVWVTYSTAVFVGFVLGFGAVFVWVVGGPVGGYQEVWRCSFQDFLCRGPGV